jgi:hypothetical protein
MAPNSFWQSFNITTVYSTLDATHFLQTVSKGLRQGVHEREPHARPRA